jgi:hypothetical protein
MTRVMPYCVTIDCGTSAFFAQTNVFGNTAILVFVRHCTAGLGKKPKQPADDAAATFIPNNQCPVAMIDR